MCHEIAERINNMRRNLRSTGRTAREWVEGYDEAMRSMAQQPPNEDLMDKQLFFKEFDKKLSSDFYTAIVAHLREMDARDTTGSPLRPNEFIPYLWELDEEDDVDEIEALPQKLRFLYSLLRGIRKVSEKRNAGGNYSVPGSPSARQQQMVDPRRILKVPDSRRTSTLSSSLEGRLPEFGTRVKSPMCPPTQEDIDKSIQDLTDMVSDRIFDANYAETFELITKNAFLRTIMMEPLTPGQSGNIFTAFTALAPGDQEDIIRNMYNDLPPDVGIQDYLMNAEIIEDWANTFRGLINENPDKPRRLDTDRNTFNPLRISASAVSDDESGSASFSLPTHADMAAREAEAAERVAAMAEAALPNNYATAPPDYQPGNDDRVGGRKSHRHRRRQRVTRKGRRGKKRRQTKRRKARRTKRR